MTTTPTARRATEVCDSQQSQHFTALHSKLRTLCKIMTDLSIIHAERCASAVCEEMCAPRGLLSRCGASDCPAIVRGSPQLAGSANYLQSTDILQIPVDV